MYINSLNTYQTREESKCKARVGGIYTGSTQGRGVRVGGGGARVHEGLCAEGRRSRIMCTGQTEGTQAVFVLLGVAGVWEVPWQQTCFGRP